MALQIWQVPKALNKWQVGYFAHEPTLVMFLMLM
jgi:hypothetical protein